jgi:hypothetical protein
MPRRKGKTGIIITWVQVKIIPNKTNLLGENRIKETRTPKGKIKKNAKGITTIKILGRTSLALFAVTMEIILTKPHNNTCNNHPQPCCKTLFHTKV